MSSAASVSMLAITALLYALTYFSFVYLLRYPRNWMVPSLQSAGASGTFFVLTIGVISVSADGIDLYTLVTSAILMAALLYIIAAPAIAFRPASPLVEYLAKNGGYAELVLAGPAVLIAVTTTNTRLQAAIAFAILIEIVWFARQALNNRSRKNYPLRDVDLRILDTQSGGYLSEFKRAHKMRELVLSSKGLSWDGCGKHTSSCPFNLYVNRLGLNTAPCCREHMKDLLNHVATGLTGMEATHWLEGGTLLGAVRDNGSLLDWEDDVDISVLLTDDLTWEKLAAGLEDSGARHGFFVDLFPHHGFISISYDQPRPRPFRWERNRMRGEIRADIAVYRKATSFSVNVLERLSKKGNMPATESGKFGLPESVVLPTEDIALVGGMFSAPNKPDAYLTALYGEFRNVEYTYVDPEAASTRARDTSDA